MQCSANDIKLSKALLTFLRMTFKGASFSGLEMDDVTKALARVIEAAGEVRRARG